MNWVRVAAQDELEEGRALRVKVGPDWVALVLSGGRYYAVEDCCSHEEASLSEGFVEESRIECPRHGAVFDLASGRPLSLPATQLLRVWPVRLEGDEILVGLPEE